MLESHVQAIPVSDAGVDDPEPSLAQYWANLVQLVEGLQTPLLLELLHILYVRILYR